MSDAINSLTVALCAVILSLGSIIALIMAHMRLRDRIEVIEAVLNRLDKESGSAAKASK
jgi:ABC-type spermidine/putrescine transport system permease subunit II